MPSAVRGPVLLPPFHLQRRLSLSAQARQCPRPPDNRAPQWWPNQSPRSDLLVM